MTPIEVKLRVKYGLRDDPTPLQIAAWAAEVEALIGSGEDSETAGRKSAFVHFAGVDDIFYASAADNIAALLKALGSKD